MRTNAIVFFTVLLCSGFVAAAQADISISELFHVDPRWEAGGYWELTVTNLTGSDVFMVVVGNTGADLVAVRYPDLVGAWYPTRIGPDEWDTNDWGHFPTDWTFPDTSTLPFATNFPGSSQVLVYYAMGSTPPIPDSAVFTGLYFNYPIEDSARSPGLGMATGSPYLVIGGDGEVVAHGETVGDVVPVREGTWGAIKALYR